MTAGLLILPEGQFTQLGHCGHWGHAPWESAELRIAAVRLAPPKSLGRHAWTTAYRKTLLTLCAPSCL